jgi:outer membrane protein assembly factor BamA
MGYDLDDFYHVTESWSQSYPSDFSKYGIGTGHQTVSSGITFDLLWDSRKNSINPENGLYSILLYRLNTRWLGSDYSWTSIYFDNRKYFSFSDTRHEVLGFRVFYWGSYGDVPYLNLPGTTLDLSARSGRGYSVARYLGKQELYAETEYRFDIARNGLWGGVVFTNAQSYTEPGSNQFEYVLPAIGAGVRLKFNKRSNTNICLDMAFGKNSFQLYLNLGELF